MNAVRLAAATLVAGCTLGASMAAALAEVPAGEPAARIDLTTRKGVAQVAGAWRYSDVRIIKTAFRAPGSDGQPGLTTVKTYDYAPHAGEAEFDDSAWPVIAPESLSDRRSNGRLAFNWYRIRLTIPERIGAFDPTGSTAVFETILDDYAEVWVDGELPRSLGQSGGSVVKGWNAPNRLVVGRDVKPGQLIQLAVFGMNGPISNPPTNYIFVRKAALEFYSNADVPFATEPQEVNVAVERLDPAIDGIVPANPKLYKLAKGFQVTEGPVWVANGGYLLFSDPNANRIYQYEPEGPSLSVYKEPSGYNGTDLVKFEQPGANGLTLDAEGRLSINQHGNRRVIRIERDGTETVLADRYRGQRLNSPNDLVYKSDGSLYFTDPDFGLPKLDQDPRKELPFNGVYRVKAGSVELLAADLKGPNGIAFSPDERHLYVGNWDRHNKVVMRYSVRPDGSLKQGEVFFDMTWAKGEDGIDGIKVDVAGNVYVSGPGGLWILSAQGKHLGTVRPPRHPHNLAWGDEDGKTLYLAAGSALYRLPLRVEGMRP